MARYEYYQRMFYCIKIDRIYKKKGIKTMFIEVDKFNDKQMKEINKGFEKGLSDEQIAIYAKPEFDYLQMMEIREGLKAGLDVSIYAKPEFNWEQMEMILIGLEDNVDVSIYAHPKFEWPQMDEIREGLVKGLNVSAYANPEFNWMQMKMIREALLALKNKSKEDIEILLNIIYNTYMK